MAIRPRWHKLFADLWSNKTRSMLVMLSIAIGVFSVGMIAGAYAIISNDMSQSYAAGHPGNIVISTDPIDQDFVHSIQRIAGVKSAEGRRFVSVRAKTQDGQYTGMDLVAMDDFQNSDINLQKPLEGNPVPKDRQILLEKKSLTKIPAAVGDTLDIQLPDDTVKQMVVAGIVQDQSTAAGDFLSAPIGFITFDTLEWLGQPSNFDRLYVTVADQPNDEAHIRQVAQAITDRLKNSGRSVYQTKFSKSNEHPFRGTIQAILGVLLALGVLIVFLSSSLIANTLNALLTQHLRYIGIMKLIGGRNYQIIGLYMAMILIFGVVALVIAIPLGGWAAYALSELIAYKMNFSLMGLRVVPSAVLIQIGIALIVPVAAAFIPIYNGVQITVQKAISGNTAAPVESGSGGLNHLFARVTAGTHRWITRPLLLSLRNTFRRKRRLVLTLFTLTMGGAIFIAVFNVRSSLHTYIDNIGNYFLADVNVNFSIPYHIQKVETDALKIEGVKAIEGWAFTTADILNPDKTVAKTIQVLAPPVNTKLVSPMLLSGRWLAPGDGYAIAVSEAILETFPNLKPGDTLRLNIADRERDWKVVGIFKFVGSQELLAYADYDTVAKLLNMMGQAFTFRIVTDQHGTLSQTQVSQNIDAYFRDHHYEVADVEAGHSSMKDASENLDVLITFLLIMALLTAAVGSMGLAGTMSMNVMERTREIGIMRSIGAVDREVMKSVIVEGALIGLISWLLGALLSFPISKMLSAIIGLAIFHTPLTLIFTWQGFAIWLVLVLILATLASILPARNAARLTIREVLAYE